MSEGGNDLEARITRGFEICLSRRPTRQELRRLEDYLAVQSRLININLTNAVGIIGDASQQPKSPAVDAATAVTLARTLMNLDEFVTRE